MIKKKLSIYFVFVAILSFLAIFMSIIQKSYFNLINPVKEVESNTLLTPINPILDTEIIEDIESRPENIESGNLNFSIEVSNDASMSSQQL